MININNSYKINRYDLDKNDFIDERLILKKLKNNYVSRKHSHNYLEKNIFKLNKDDKHY